MLGESNFYPYPSKFDFSFMNVLFLSQTFVYVTAHCFEISFPCSHIQYNGTHQLVTGYGFIVLINRVSF